MGLLSHDPKYLAATLLDDLAFLLNSRGINPVLGIADPLSTGLRRSENACATCRGFSKHLLLGKGGRTVVSGKRFFDDDVFAQTERLHRELFMGGGRSAEIDHIHCRTKLGKRIKCADPRLLCKGVSRFRGF